MNDCDQGTAKVVLKVSVPGEEMIGRLWDTLAGKAIPSFLKPWRMRREGEARIDIRRREMLSLAQTERDVADIQTGRKSMEDFYAAPALPGAGRRVAPTLGLPAVVESAEARRLMDLARKEINLARSVLDAEASVERDADTAPEGWITDDWLYRWRDYASDTSSEQLQALWGRLLAGELKAPGSFSLRTLDFVRSLTSAEATDIARTLDFAVENVIYRSDPHLEAAGLKFDFMLRMEQLGILTGVGGQLTTTFKTAKHSSFSRFLVSHGRALFARSDDPRGEIEIPSFPLSALGVELLRLGHFQANEPYLRALGLHVARCGFSVVIGDLVREENRWGIEDPEDIVTDFEEPAIY
jgi:hypothetical protein